jgi:hypothetical protein
MHELKLEFMPEATQKNFARLKDDPRLAGFTLVGGTALALQIGHRVSEDLDFNLFGNKLPIRHKDPEHFKSVVTGVVPLDKSDEGFSSIHLNVRTDEIYKYFKKLINGYEIRVVQQLRS